MKPVTNRHENFHSSFRLILHSYHNHFLKWILRLCVQTIVVMVPMITSVMIAPTTKNVITLNVLLSLPPSA